MKVLRVFCFAVTVTDPDNICRYPYIGHRWLDLGDLPDLRPSPTGLNPAAIVSWTPAARRKPDPPLAQSLPDRCVGPTTSTESRWDPEVAGVVTTLALVPAGTGIQTAMPAELPLWQSIPYGTTASRVSMGRRQVVESVNAALKGAPSWTSPEASSGSWAGSG